MVYWTEAHFGARSQLFTMTQMNDSLNFMAELRKRDGVDFVTFIQQNPDSVGSPGVAAVVDGKTPDGEAYEWSKAHRAGKSRR